MSVPNPEAAKKLLLRTVPRLVPDEATEPLGTVDTGPPRKWIHFCDWSVTPGTISPAWCGSLGQATGLPVGTADPTRDCPDCLRILRSKQ